MLNPFKLEPVYRDYVWGGNRLRPGIDPTAEAWIIFEGNQIVDGPFAGKTLAELAEKEGRMLLGSRPVAQTGTRFPLLVKLLDCARWLSLQVHPNDEQAVQLEGAGHFGKTEAWYVVEAEAGAQLISGFCPGVTCDDIDKAVRSGEILDLVERRDIQTGDSILVVPGTIHALGPGSLVYEVQQTSDITYRVYDWGRPMTGRRKLHIEQAVSVLNPQATGELSPRSALKEGKKRLAASEYFELELITRRTGTEPVNTREESFTALTVVDGSVRVEGQDWSFELGRFETLLVPAVCSDYTVHFSSPARVLNAFVP